MNPENVNITLMLFYIFLILVGILFVLLAYPTILKKNSKK